MAAHIIDSIFFKDLYSTTAMRAVFDDVALLQKWLDVEVALAQAEAELGLIPAAAAAEIAHRARAENLNPQRLKALIDQTVHPIVPLIRVLAEACADHAGEYIHWGATTQDIMDTATILQLKEAVVILENRLVELIELLTDLARRHRDTLMAGRTHGQQALPITFGFKAAIWLAEMGRHQQRLEECKPRLLVGQFAGAVGTLASVPEQGLQIQARMMELLGLGVPPISWHTARDNVAEFTMLLGLIAGTTGKIAREIIALQKTEVGEVEEPFNEGKVGSSTMPHKRNPMLGEAVVALARLVMNLTPNALNGLIQEHERDWTYEHMEWAYLPEVCLMTDGALHVLIRIIAGLRVNPERMRQNLGQLNGLMLSERVMLALGKKLGRQTAHDIVYACAMRAYENNRPFRETLTEHSLVSQHLGPAEIDELLDPQQYTGLAGVFVDRVLGGFDELATMD